MKAPLSLKFLYFDGYKFRLRRQPHHWHGGRQMLLGFQLLHIWHGNFLVSLVLKLKRRGSSVLPETSLRRCRLGLSNVNGLIMIYKNWPTDARSECEVASTNVVEFLNKEHEILDDHGDELEEAGYFEN